MLDKLPDWLSELPLTGVILNKNRFENFPAVLYDLPNLTQIDLGENNIDLSSVDFRKFPKLQRLSLSDLSIKQLPESIFSCGEITHLDLSSNQIQKFPSGIFALEKLERLDLEYNNINAIPDEIFRLKQLKRLDLRNNRIVKLPHSIVQLEQLQFNKFDDSYTKYDGLSIQGNPLTTALAAAAYQDQPDATNAIFQVISGEKSRLPNENEEVPEVKIPDIGPKFVEESDIIDILADGNLANSNSFGRLRNLHEELRLAIEDLDGSLARSGNAYNELRAVVGRYKTALAVPTSAINIDQIFSLGLRLDNARVAVERNFENLSEPPLENNQYEALKSSLQIHSAFIVFSDEGKELLEASLRYEYSPGQDKEFKEIAGAVTHGINTTPGLLTDQARDLVVGAVDNMAPATQRERAGLFGRLAVGGVLAAIAISAAGKISGEIMIHSSYGQILITEAAPLLDKLVYFLVRNEYDIRALAAYAPDSFGWLSNFIDWLKIKLLDKFKDRKVE